MATLVTFDGIGLDHNSQIFAGVAGVGDTPCSGVGGDTAGTPPLTKHNFDPGFADSFQCWPSTNAQMSYATWTLPTGRTFGVRFYFKRATAVASAVELLVGLGISGSSVQTARWGMSGTATPGQFRVYPSVGANIASPSDLIVPNVWYRVEGYVKQNPNADATYTDGSTRMLVYDGDSTTALHDTGWVTSQNMGDLTDVFRVGMTGLTPANPDMVRFAHFAVTDNADTLIGPWVAPPPASGGAWVKQSGALTDATLFVKSGSSAQPVTGVTVK